MMPHNLFRLQLMETFANRRRTVLRIGVSALLALPFIFVGMPARAKVAGVVMVVLFTTFFGSAIAHARLCEDRRLARLTLLPIPRPLLWLDLLLSAAVGRLVPTLVIVGGFALFNSPAINAPALFGLAAALCAAVLLLTLLGTLTGHLARSSAEVHLFSAVIAGMLAFVSGVTPGIDKLDRLTGLLSVNPIHRLLAILTDLTNGTPTASFPASLISVMVLGVFALVVLWRWVRPGGYFAPQKN